MKLIKVLKVILIATAVGGIAIGLGIAMEEWAYEPTVYAVYGDANPCERAEDMQGNPIPCAQALKGRYEIIYIAPKHLREGN